MKKILPILFILLSFSAFETLAQNQEALEKIESARIALITERLDLTPEQAERFWPLYREYSRERQNLRQEYMNARRQVDRQSLTDEESRALIQKGLELKERELQLDKNYADRLNQVISNRQLLELRKAEQDFRKMLLERLQKRNERREQFNQRQRLRDNN